ncbi:MAG: sigma-70 family RNA polymerase sigma factor [Zavarzinella sp.]
MDSSHSITNWIRDWQQGDPKAAENLWQRFSRRVEGMAKSKLQQVPGRFGDQADLAQEVFAAVFTGIQQDRFQQLHSRDDLWQILAMVTARRAANLWRKANAANELGESACSTTDEQVRVLECVAEQSDEQLSESLGFASMELLEKLEPKLRHVALMRWRGYSNQEIADELGRSVKSVERYLAMIRMQWTEDE